MRVPRGAASRRCARSLRFKRPLDVFGREHGAGASRLCADGAAAGARRDGVGGRAGGDIEHAAAEIYGFGGVRGGGFGGQNCKGNEKIAIFGK